MNQRFILIGVIALTLAACSGSRSVTTNNANPLVSMAKDPRLDSVMSHPERYEVQIIYTQIDRDANQQPRFTHWYWQADSAQYFYPASTVKMPLALLSLEKINQLKERYPKISRETPYLLDSLRNNQVAWRTDSTAPNYKPTIAHDVREIFAVSDNAAYNRMFEFLGRQHINEALHQKGYTRTGIMHRFDYARENQYAQPISFYEPTYGIYQEGEKTDPTKYSNPQKGLLKGKGHYNRQDSLVMAPIDFAQRNWFAITDMEKMLRATIFPKAVPEQWRFNLTEDDYRFVHRSMGLFPREFEYPKYLEEENWDSYVKFVVMGDTEERQNGQVRIFNKVGEAYGTLTDMAYVVDFEHQVEFMLTATILCNSDGIFNDNQYDYDQTGFPFLANLGRVVLEHEIKRSRAVKPDLSYWQSVVK
jgi:Beta-lactamase enzyme family